MPPLSAVGISGLQAGEDVKVVTRNRKDFVKAGVHVLNPFTE